ncbi:hypothetical protein [Kordiimonas aquimaris]|uniref:hypothetical protein n=1 Tax=Kordiimonas aquimaris TaxID=707591 RepID=UPI0021D05EDE|nr:hypothetical protein [Kordiimonas aquimaris]
MAADNKEIDTETGGSAKGLLLIGLLGGLAIGGAVAYFYASNNAANTSTEEEIAAEKKEETVPLQAIRFERLTVPIYSSASGSSRFIGNFFINIDVLVKSDEDFIAVRRSEPQLQHAFISAISKADLMREGSSQQLDLEKTAVVLKKKANEVLSGNIVADVSVIEALRIPN